uniref:Thioesterase n=1 Tax=uncultured Thiotrichaceae bacterium TaxID=298394 RepID=A0A6S6ULY7_9GAMM|nr:MAG: Thioesterase [uncultured Thiotrichaceae bacterium]
MSITPAFSCTLPVRWGDMDAYNHVNNTVYFRFFEEARVQLIEAVAGGQIAGRDDGPVIITANCTFLKLVVYPNDVRVDCYLSDPGRSSFMVRYELFAASDPKDPACTGDSKVVWVDHALGRSVELPSYIREKFS